MGSDDSDTQAVQTKQLIDEIQVRVDTARANLERAGGADAAKQPLAEAIVRYWSALHRYRDEDVLRGQGLPDIEPIKRRLGQEVSVPGQAARARDGLEMQAVPAIYELGADYLIETSFALDDIAKQLGFAPAATDVPAHNDISHDDLEALLTARGQEQAVDNLPQNHDPEDSSDGGADDETEVDT